MSIEDTISRIVIAGNVFEFTDSGPRSRISGRRVFLSKAAVILVNGVAGGLPVGDPGVREALQRLLYETNVPVGTRNDSHCKRTNCWVLMKRLDKYDTVDAEVWELRCTNPHYRLFGFFLSRGVVVFTHGSQKKGIDDEGYRDNTELSEKIRIAIGVIDTELFLQESVYDYF